MRAPVGLTIVRYDCIRHLTMRPSRFLMQFFVRLRPGMKRIRPRAKENDCKVARSATVRESEGAGGEHKSNFDPLGHDGPLKRLFELDTIESPLASRHDDAAFFDLSGFDRSFRPGHRELYSKLVQRMRDSVNG